MQPYKFLGIEIRKLRHATGETLEAAAQDLEVGRSYLNKIELGIHKPSKELLDRIIDHFSVKDTKAAHLQQLALLENPRVIDEGAITKEEKESMKQEPQVPPTQINMDPMRNPVLYTDSIFVNSSPYGLVLDVAQNVPGGQQVVVSRIGMSIDHAKRLIAVMSDHLEKHEL